MQFDKNIHSWVFQRLQIALVLRTRAILIVFEKLTRACMFFSKLHSKPHYYLYTNVTDLNSEYTRAAQPETDYTCNVLNEKKYKKYCARERAQ